MATLRMATPWQHTTTGIYYLRRRIPERFRRVCGQRGDQFKLSLKTRDAAAARAAWAGALKVWEEKLAEWNRLLNVVVLTQERADSIAAVWAEKVGSTLRTDGRASDAYDVLLLPELRNEESTAELWKALDSHARLAAALAGVTVAAESWNLLVNAMAVPVMQAFQAADLRYLARPGGRVAAHLGLHVPQNGPEAPPEGRVIAAQGGRAEAVQARQVALDDLLKGWEAVTATKARTRTETGYVIGQVKAFIGHGDAARLAADDLKRWRSAGLGAGGTNNGWNNRLSLLGQVLKHGVREGLLPANVADGLRLSRSRAATRLPYADAEAARILLAARKETRPSTRWAHWVMAFSGMRVGEVLQLTAGDVREEGGVYYIHINEDHPTKSVKTSERRNVPLHPALVAEGFLAYVRTIEGDGPVFPDKGLDAHGKRGGRGWNVVGKWVRTTVGITEKAKAPDHAWRHRMEDELRNAEVPEDVRDAITGHARRTTGRLYGVRGEALARLHRELSKLKVPPGVPMPGDRSD